MTDQRPTPPQDTNQQFDRQLARQVLLLQAFGWFTYPFACVPFLFFWFRAHGVDLEQYGLLMSVYYATMVLAEVPSGAMADRFGPRAAMMVGPVALAAGFLVLVTAPGFEGFAVGEMLLGIGHAILSGPPSTLLYETLQERRETGDYHRYESRIQAARLAGTGSAFLVGGAIAHHFGLAPTLYVTAGLCAAAAPIAWLLGKPRHIAPPTGRLALYRQALGQLRRPGIPWIVAYFTLLFFLLRYGFHNYQPWLESRGIDQQEDYMAIGLLFFGLNAVAAIAARLGPRLLKNIGAWPLLWIMPLCMDISLAWLALVVATWGQALFLFQQIPYAVHQPLVQQLMHDRIQSGTRTTVWSLLSLIARLVLALLLWATFHLQETHGLDTTFLWVAGLGVAIQIPVMLYGKRLFPQSS